ncbi:MAG: undecaprenyl-diphosphate phosphatase [Tepidisphaeraceae bacterium]
MNDYVLSIILGVVEGLTEFLPVSSTAHIRITQELLDISLDEPYWKMYSVVIQLGAILSVVVYFWRRIIEFLKTFPKGADGTRTILTHPLSMVLIAFIVTAGPCYILDKKIGENLESLKVMGLALLIGGVVMCVVDVLCNKPRTTDMARMTFPQAIVIGAAQIFAAVFPGTSRSMSTIAAGQVMGLSRSAALEFSFFLSIPVMFAATGLKLTQAVVKGMKGKSEIAMDAHRWGVLAVGLIVSFVVAWAVIAWFMHWVRKHGFVPFAVYRIVAGAAVLIWAWRAGLH